MARAWCLLKTGNPTRSLLDLEAAERLAPELLELPALQKRLQSFREGQGSSTDYYKILGLARDATIDMIRKAYRNLAKLWHPDKRELGVSQEEAEQARCFYPLRMIPYPPPMWYHTRDTDPNHVCVHSNPLTQTTLVALWQTFRSNPNHPCGVVAHL